jgi:hypothetical protein
VAEDAVEHLHGQVLIFNTVKELHALDIVKKSAYTVFFAECREAGLAKVAVRDMSDVMPESNCFNEIFVQPQAAPDRPGDLRDELDMNHPVGDVIIFDKVKDLSLVYVARVRPCVDDPVCIPGVGSSDIFCDQVMTSRCICTGCGKRGEEGFALISHDANGRIEPFIKKPRNIPFFHLARLSVPVCINPDAGKGKKSDLVICRYIWHNTIYYNDGKKSGIPVHAQG